MTTIGKCPACGEDVYCKVVSSTEYQGDYPHGGLVTWLEVLDIEGDCKCGRRTGVQEMELNELACETYDETYDRGSYEEDYINDLDD